MAEDNDGEEVSSTFPFLPRRDEDNPNLADPSKLKKGKSERMSELSDAPGRDTVALDVSTPLFQQLLGNHLCVGRNLQTVLNISIEESAVGGSKFIEVERAVVCSACARNTDVASCAWCNSKRVVLAPLKGQVTFPPGVLSGHSIVLVGAGDAADDVSQLPGDLIVEVRVAPHAFLRRVCNDCHTELFLTFAQATLGCSLYIPSLYGQAVLVVPPGTQSYSFISIPNEGFPNSVAENERGCMVVKLLVKVPQNVSIEEAALLRQFDKSVRERGGLEMSRNSS